MGETPAAAAHQAEYGAYPTNCLAVDELDLAPDATVVDVGCGTGAALRHAARRVTRGRLVGIDPAADRIARARELLEDHPAAHRIELVVAPAHRLPLADDTVDVVLAIDSFDHWGSGQVGGLGEVRRVLRPGGGFVVVKAGGVPEHEEVASSFQASLELAGFRVVDQRFVQSDDVGFTMWRCDVD